MRFLVIQAIIFFSVAVLSIVIRWEFSILLSIVGALIVVFRFMGSSKDEHGNRLPPADFSYNFMLIGLVPIIVGVFMAFM